MLLHNIWIAWKSLKRSPTLSVLIVACIALGMAWDFLLPEGGQGGYRLVQAGVALFILLPVARVALMLALFLRERDYAYTAISALVLLIIAAGVLSGLR